MTALADVGKLLTSLTVPDISNPKIRAIRVNKRDERRRPIHAQPNPLPVGAAFMLVIDDAPDLGIRKVLQTVDGPAKEVKHVLGERLVKRHDSACKGVRDDGRVTRWVVQQRISYEVLNDDWEVVRNVLGSRIP